MSGLVVVVRRNGEPVPRELVECLGAAVAHRGPDGVTSAVRANVAVIHAALHATPESRFEHQPLEHENGTWYVADARIDNRREVIDALGWQGRPGPVTDLDVLAEVDQRWGVEGLDRLVGDFAYVAIRPDGHLRAARDHLGIKPLYYWVSPRWIVISSELRQIVAHPEAPTALDPALAGQYLSGQVEDACRTVVAGARRVPAAHVLEIETEPRLRRYWMPRFDEPIELGSRDEYRDRCRELFTEAVRSRLRTDGSVGAEVSGGLDSTSVAAVAHRLIDRDTDLHTYSCLFPDSPGTDERPFIDAAVETLGLDWAPIESDPDRPRWVDDDVCFWGDIPIPPDGPDHVALCRQAVTEGCRVVLTGHGGDHWFDGAHLVVGDLVQRRRAAAAWRVASSLTGGGIIAPLQLLVKEMINGFRLPWLRRPGRIRAPWVIGPARLTAHLDQRRIPGRQPRRYRSWTAQRRYEGEVSGYEAMSREIFDRIGAVSGVELRHPYLDRRLMEFACRVPVGLHTEPDRNRALQRDMLSGILPTSILERTTKASFGMVWLREIERHLPTSLAETRVVQLGWIDEAAASTARARTDEVVRARRGGADLIALWGLVQVESLLGRYDPADGGPVEPPTPYRST